ncbi:hypothetical protein PIIN_07075 [Serendipita indica DSM 11827]|uniref:Uncharacterized protein n=1 Tax=Serendipita indica (strain DSM 11827) TaxID=1109443 RepID=G4TP81_SERID|nr:hypothetical protein PIIN_07075 [Serendipita indica DSM 11827]
MKLVALLGTFGFLVVNVVAQTCQASLENFGISIVPVDVTSPPVRASLLPTNASNTFNLGTCASCSSLSVPRWDLRGNELTTISFNFGRRIMNNLVLPNKPLSFRQPGNITLPVIYPSYCVVFDKGSTTKAFLAAGGNTGSFFSCENLSPQLAGTGAFDIWYAVNATDAFTPTRGKCTPVTLVVTPN